VDHPVTSPEQFSVGVPGLGHEIQHPSRDSLVSTRENPFFGRRGRKPLNPQQRLSRAEPFADPAHQTLATPGEQERELER
jgi:hypothetical protein